MRLSVLLALSVAICACSRQDEHFTGTLHSSASELSAVDSSSVKEETPLQPVMQLRNAAEGFFVCDSLAFFLNSVSTDCFIDVYNISTAERAGSFIHRGSAKDEFMGIFPFSHVFRDGGCVKSITNAPNENTCFTWNITESLKTGQSVIEDVCVQDWRDHYQSAPRMLAPLHDSLVVCATSSINCSGSAVTAPEIHIVSKGTGGDVSSITPFDNPIFNPQSTIPPERFFNGALRVKPDGKKLVTAYYYMPLISILDLETCRLDGYMLGKEIDYGVFETDMRAARMYYMRVACSDDRIFTLWNGQQVTDQEHVTGFDVLHVFDWQGQLLDVIKTDHELNEIYFDSFSNTLYGCSEAESMLYEIEF